MLVKLDSRNIHIHSRKVVSKCNVYSSLDMMINQFYRLQWRHNERDGISIHRRLDCLPKHLFRRRTKKISKLHVIVSLWPVNSPQKGPVTQKMFPLDYVIMRFQCESFEKLGPIYSQHIDIRRPLSKFVETIDRENLSSSNFYILTSAAPLFDQFRGTNIPFIQKWSLLARSTRERTQSAVKQWQTTF